MKENSIEEDIKNAEHFIKSIKTDKEYKEENGWHGYYNKEIVELARMLEHILSDYKRVLKENEELKEKSKEENELNKIIKDTKLDELFCRRNGKKVEQAIKLRDELLKLPECKLYGIKKCKKSVILISKEEVIPVQKVKDKIEHYQKLQDNYIEKYDEINEGLQAMINALQELLEGRK